MSIRKTEFVALRIEDLRWGGTLIEFRAMPITIEDTRKRYESLKDLNSSLEFSGDSRWCGWVEIEVSTTKAVRHIVWTRFKKDNPEMFDLDFFTSYAEGDRGANAFQSIKNTAAAIESDLKQMRGRQVVATEFWGLRLVFIGLCEVGRLLKMEGVEAAAAWAQVVPASCREFLPLEISRFQASVMV